MVCNEDWATHGLAIGLLEIKSPILHYVYLTVGVDLGFGLLTIMAGWGVQVFWGKMLSLAMPTQRGKI